MSKKNKILKYSTLNKKISKILSFKNYDTLYLDEWAYKTNFSFNDKKDLYLKNIIISEKVIGFPIVIANSNAENIYFENSENLGGLTLSYEILKRHMRALIIEYKFDYKCNLSKINLILDKDNFTINLEKDLEKIEFDIYKEDNNEYVTIKLIYNHKILKYKIDNLKNITEEKISYTFGEEDLINNNLDITKYFDYSELKFHTCENIDTLIINKNFLKNTNLLKGINTKNLFKLTINKIKIIDDNNMKLIPSEKIVSIDGSILVDDNYIYIDNKNDEILIYLNKQNEIKVIGRNELLKENDVVDVVFQFEHTKLSFSGYELKTPRKINLILIKYKDETYKIIDFDKSYNLDSLFLNFLKLNPSDYFSLNEAIQFLFTNNLKEIFKLKDFDNDKFYKMYNDFEKYKLYLLELKNMGLTDNAIDYLFDKNYRNIIDPKDKFNIKNLTKKEIDFFNEYSEEHKKLKLKKYKKEIVKRGGNYL